jgi:hypothetical protein
MSGINSLAASGLNVASLFAGSTNSGGFDFTTLYPSSGAATSAYGAGGVATALKNADANEAKQLADAAKQLDVQRDLARYAKVVASAKTLDDVLDDPVARKVFLTAEGLRDQVDYVGLAKRALKSDPTDANSVASKMESVNKTWLQVAAKYSFNLVGVSPLKISDSIKEISDNYIAEKRLDNLDAQLPGLGTAMLFKKVAASLDTPLKILGSAIGREVITTAFNIPKQIAVQEVEAQEKVIAARMDPKKLADSKFVDQLVQRYLININGGAGGVTA